jgi:hypothetical protein
VKDIYIPAERLVVAAFAFVLVGFFGVVAGIVVVVFFAVVVPGVVIPGSFVVVVIVLMGQITDKFFALDTSKVLYVMAKVRKVIKIQKVRQKTSHIYVPTVY